MVISSPPPGAVPESPHVDLAADDDDESSVSHSKWYLESIYIENFKSYRDVTRVGPLRPFCAIIGPNGSGKSNLMDAISFVMGERTASLRVKRMSELVHGASNGKTPLSANASVTAVFKQRDEKGDIPGVHGAGDREERFARVIRGAASEYLVNGEVVSQRQYFEQLKRLGINARGKNFLVFQGAIEDIAMKNEKERTALLEELCGSGALKEEYERSKDELAKVERKIEISHMKKKNVLGQRREVRGEVEEAKQYNELLEKQSEKEVELYLFKIFHVNREISSTVVEIAPLMAGLPRLESSKLQTEEEWKGVKKERGEAVRLLGSKEAVLNRAEKEKSERLPKQIEVVQKRKHLEKKFTLAEKSLKQAKENRLALDDDLVQLNRSLKDVQGKEKAFLEEHEELQMTQGVDVTLRESQITEYWDLKKRVLKKTEDEKQKSETLRRRKKDANDVFNSVSQEKTGLESKLELTDYEISEKEKLGKKSRETVVELKGQLDSKEKEVVPLKSEILGAEESIVKCRQELEKISAEIEAAKIDRYEANRRKKRRDAINALKTHFKGVKDRVVNLCKSRHSRYDIAITKILSKNMEAIVVDGEKTARDCIQYLKEQMMDPEVFLPLDLLEVGPLRDRIREQAQSESIHLAYDLLEFGRDVEKAILHCVQSTVVCPTTKVASGTASGSIFREAFNAVSLDGTYYHTSGVISGGKAELQKKARRWSDNVLSGKEQQKLQIAEELKQALRTSRKKNQLDILEQELNGIRSRLKYADEDVKLQTRAAQDLKRKKKELEAQLEGVNVRWSKAEAAASVAGKELKLIQKRIHAIEDKVFKSFCEQISIPNIRAYEETDVREQEEFNRQKESIQHKLKQIQMKIEYDMEQRRTLEANIQRWLGTVSGLEEELKVCKTEEESIETEMSGITARLCDIQNEVKDLKESIEDKGKEVTTLTKNLSSIVKLLLSSKTGITRLQYSLLQAKLKRHELFKQCKLTGTNVPFQNGSLDDIHVGGSGPSAMTDSESEPDRIEQTLEKEDDLQPDYAILSLDLQNVSGARVKKSEEELEAQLHELEVKITQIQAPNMKANQRWENINNKVREQQVEFDEMRKKVKVARDAFEKVKKERLDKFMECFNKISQNIDGIYKSLTQRRSAQAILGVDNPEEPYLDGVTYHCVVPGKRFQPMNNLSGGEKTLAALALLFAIHSFEPAPVFVLDEIDAALDNTNIARVISYIKRSTATLQVLVISLKEGFFENADALLGVAPDPQDSDCLCSKLYSLDLTEYDQLEHDS